MPTLTMPPRECRVHGVEARPNLTEFTCTYCGHAFGPGELDRYRSQRDSIGQPVGPECPLCMSPL